MHAAACRACVCGRSGWLLQRCRGEGAAAGERRGHPNNANCVREAMMAAPHARPGEQRTCLETMAGKNVAAPCGTTLAEGTAAAGMP
jgi:hypothetical protein